MEEIDWTECSYEEARSVLKKWRDEHERRSEETVEIWEHILSSYDQSLGDELWAILEQVTIAALDSNRQDLALECLQTLNKQFPNSTRVTKLQALRLESLGKYEEAQYLYDNLLQLDDTNMSIRKRKIAIEISQGNRLEAIKMLDEYLHSFVNDSEAWAELGELYLQENDILRAIYCFEEVLLAAPNNSSLYCRLGELRYTLGGQENIEVAKNYFEKSIKLNLNARSLYGLILACNSLLGKSTGQKKREIVVAAQNAIESLGELYKEKGENPNSSVCNKVVQSLKSSFV
ncbi:unnamed protein product [Bursaphelenchus okinawaensis]|uniref:ER membrane protein complex subunit 2 n=1 Tax=Bursaphelenchus okinawaensis TaxID=465554 RepID=A0A811K8S0_9BILA|nr:unnamed protein product [Bursaphelenchus okinawaensis]CAG9094369.1 unnamed protein product [Bursaphelenchus okinawaensis]